MTPAPDVAVDVVVVGSGHNGLVAACYLARAGLSVEVVESDDVLGGAVSTVDTAPPSTSSDSTTSTDRPARAR